MYQYTENEDGKIGLHDCRTTHMSYENQTLSFDFPEGFYILNEDEPERSGISKMKCHIIDEDIDGISIYIYREDPSGMVIREDWTDNFISAVNDGSFEFEFVTTYRSYQHILFKGYAWFDEEPYYMECEIELHIDKISYMWNENGFDR